MLALKPYWGKPTVRDFWGGDGNVGIMRSPVRAIVLPDRPKRSPPSKTPPRDFVYDPDFFAGLTN